jgi:hypothetical protein
MRSISLSPGHYAAAWPDDIVYTSAELTELGCQMAQLPEGLSKEDKLLEILKCFQGYLLKYMSMILNGHLPLQRTGNSRAVNRDTQLFLLCFVPKEKALNKASLMAACRTLHLAFKGMNPDEVFDQLILCMVKSVRKYDPYFHEKVKAVVGIIEGDEFHEKKLFTAAAVSRALGYGGAGYIRYLAKRLFLVAGAPLSGEPQFRRSPGWPPPAAFFQAGSVGLSYFGSKWFRYYLVDYIHSKMGELESKEGVLQLHHDQEAEYGDHPSTIADHGLCHSGGNYVNPRTGKASAVDLTLCKFPLDIGKLNLEWVQGTPKKLFTELSKKERHLLYCLYARDMDWEGISSTFDLNIREAKKWHLEILEKLQAKVKGAPTYEPLSEFVDLDGVEVPEDLVLPEILG